MRYIKPTVMDLSARASGDGLMSCTGGNSPTGHEQVCGAGTGPSFSAACNSGPSTGDCASGTSASFTCLPGASTVMGLECTGGYSGAAGDCTNGFSFV